MSFHKREIEEFFKKKMKCADFEGRNHRYYELRVRGKKLPLPPLTAERGSGDLTDRNLKGLATDLGLSRHGFDEAVRCPLSRACVLLCVAARVLVRAIDRYEAYYHRDPITYPETELLEAELLPARKSAEAIIEELALDPETPKRWKAVEQKELSRVRPSIDRASKYDEFHAVTDGWLQWAEGHVGN